MFDLGVLGDVCYAVLFCEIESCAECQAGLEVGGDFGGGVGEMVEEGSFGHA